MAIDFRVDYDSAADWDLYEWKTAGSPPLSYQVNRDATIVRQGSQSQQFVVHPGDVFGGTSGERALGNWLGSREDLLEGQERSYGWSTYFPSDWRSPANWGIFHEWHNADGTFQQAPIKFDSVGGQLSVSMNTGQWTVGPTWEYNHRSTFFPAPFPIGTWHDFVVRGKWQRTATGFLQVYHRVAPDDQYVLRLDLQNVPTLVWRDAGGGSATLGTVYIQHGYYRSAETFDSIIYDDNFRRGETLEDIMVGGPPPGHVRLGHIHGQKWGRRV